MEKPIHDIHICWGLLGKGHRQQAGESERVQGPLLHKLQNISTQQQQFVSDN